MVVTDRMARRFTDNALAAMADTPAAAAAQHLSLLDTPERRARADYAARAMVRVLGGTHSRRVAECVVELQTLIREHDEERLLWGEQVDAAEVDRLFTTARRRRS